MAYAFDRLNSVLDKANIFESQPPSEDDENKNNEVYERAESQPLASASTTGQVGQSSQAMRPTSASQITTNVGQGATQAAMNAARSRGIELPGVFGNLSKS